MSDIPEGREFWLDLRHQITRRIRHPSDTESILHSAIAKFHQTVCNLGIDNFRRRKNTADACEAGSSQGDTPLSDEVVVFRERLKGVQAGIHRLPPDTKEIFIMHRWHEMKYQEIADRLGTSVSAIEKHVASAMLSLSDWKASSPPG